MTLLDLKPSADAPSYLIAAIGGDLSTHRRLVDMGLLGMSVRAIAMRDGATLISFGEFSAVVGKEIAEQITVVEGEYEYSSLRKSERRQNNAF